MVFPDVRQFDLETSLRFQLEAAALQEAHAYDARAIGQEDLALIMDERARRARERAQLITDELRSESDQGGLAPDVPP